MNTHSLLWWPVLCSLPCRYPCLPLGQLRWMCPQSHICRTSASNGLVSGQA